MKNEITLCERCGASLKHSYVFGGKIYGSECIRVVTGLRAMPLHNETVECAIRRQAAQDAARGNFLELDRKQDEKRAARVQALQPIIAKLSPATGTFGNFESDVREMLQRGECLTLRQARIVCKILKDKSVMDLLLTEIK